jgi:CheY-like chemotaxis protein
MPPDVIEHVFEPFFTTKPEGKGTGLGLSMVYGFVKQSHGHVNIDSEVGQGTTIEIFLPRAREAEDRETDAETGSATGGSETILVVEDDSAVRGTIVEMLSELGYRVLEARDAQSALVIIESGVPIDLLFTDVVMPGPLRSPDMARKAQERLPGLAVLFTSGYTEDAIVHGGRLDDGLELLSKPYSREALARKIRHILRSRSQRAGNGKAATPAESLHGEVESSPPLSGPLNILLVEDDPITLFATSEMLTDLGHVVFEAMDAEQALAALGKDAFDILITDLSLPGMPGDKLAERAIAEHPNLGIVVASGYGALPSGAGSEALRHAVLLQKPYSQQGLANAINAAMKPSAD